MWGVRGKKCECGGTRGRERCECGGVGKGGVCVGAREREKCVGVQGEGEVGVWECVGREGGGGVCGRAVVVA